MREIIRIVLYYFSMHNTIFYIYTTDVPFLHSFQSMLIPFNFRPCTIILYILYSHFITPSFAAIPVWFP